MSLHNQTISSQSSSFLKSSLCQILIIITLTFSAYSFMVSDSFKTMDDYYSIIDDPDIRSFDNLEKVFHRGFFRDQSYYRPLVITSFMLEYHCFGLNPFFYYLTNIFLHISSAVVVLYIARMLLNNSWQSFNAALLFGIHPVQTEAVANIAGRSILLCGLFSLFAFWFFLLFLKQRRKILYLSSLGFFILALLSKEAAVMLPVLIFSYLLIISSTQQKRNRVFEACLPLWPFAVVLGGYFFVRHHLGITHLFYWPSLSDWTLGVLTFARGVITYLRLFIFPVDLHFDRSRVVFQSFYNIEIGGTLLFWLLIFILIRRKKLSREILFSLSWFFIGLFPVSQIISSIGVQPGSISLAEHFLYLPSVGIFILMSVVFKDVDASCLRRQVIPRISLWIVAISFGLFLFLTTVQNNIAMRDEKTMVARSLAFDPNNSRLLYALGMLEVKDAHFNKAQNIFAKILTLDPDNVRARIALGKSLCDQGKYWEGLQEYDKVGPTDPHLQKLLDDNRSRTYALLIKRYEDIVKNDPQNAKAYYSLGVIYTKMNQLPEAIAYYEKAANIDAHFTNALFNLASTLEGVGRREEAKVYYEQIMNQPDVDQFQKNYATAHLQALNKQGQ